MTIISMWSGPRNISTTMMRSFANRDDCIAIDEPFYASYLARSGADHPYGAETIAAYPIGEQDVQAWINRPLSAGKTILFLKHIAYHLSDDADLSFLLAHRNFLLIREPRRMVASYSARSVEVQPIVRSYAMARRVHDFLAAKELPCPIVDAADVLAAPEPILRALCLALDISFDRAMLSWPPGPRPEDGPWGPHWYEAVWASTGFRAPVEKKLSLSPDLEAIAAECDEAYRDLSARRIRV